jgi:5S rRNA maturation endonuclease (ribonuclease M5)
MLEDLSYINVKDLLESTGISNISESSGEVSFSCPGDDHRFGDRSASARMNYKTSAWICHGCGVKGNAITFLAWHKQIPETIARRLLEERYGGGRISAEVGGLEQEVKRIMNPVVVEEEDRIPPAESWLEKFKVDWRNKNWCQGCSPIAETEYEMKYTQPCCGCTEPPPYKKYMYDRGFDYKILEQWQIGYDEMSERITIPIRDNLGNLVGFKGRAYKENTIPRYMILGDYGNPKRYGFQPYQKSKYIFGLDRLMQYKYVDIDLKWEWDKWKDVIICEGELNVIAMNQHEIHAVGIAGSEFSQTQCDLIVRQCSSAILFLDNDKAGNKGTKKVVEMLSPYMPIKIVQNAAGDAAELDTKTIRDLITSARSALELQVEQKI